MKSLRYTILCSGLAASLLLPTSFAAQRDSDTAQQELSRMAGAESTAAQTTATAAAKTRPTSEPQAKPAAPKEAVVAASQQETPAKTMAAYPKAEQAAPKAEQAAEADMASQLPNPYVEYTSYEALTNALGFRPLIMVKSTGFECKILNAIGGKTADIRYQSRYGETGRRAEYTVRTERAGDKAPEALSGIYGYTWTAQQVSATTVQVAEISPSSFAAFWESGGYAFSIYATNVNRWDFLGTLTDNFIDLTEHYYKEAPVATGN